MSNIILAQVVGFVALVLVAISYFCKDKLTFHILQTFADIFYGAAYLFVNSYVAGFITFLSAMRCIYFFFAEKYNFKYKYHFLSLFILGYIFLTIMFWQMWTDIVPLCTCVLFTIAYSFRDVQKLKYMSIIPNVILIVFNIYSLTFASAALDFMEVIIIIVAIISFKKNSQNKKCDVTK